MAAQQPQFDMMAVKIPPADVRGVFEKLTAQWRADTRLMSSVQRRVLHPAYQQIIGLGPAAVPLILHELQERRDHWIWALYAIAREDPAPPDASFDEAVDCWLRWGRERGLLNP